MQKTSTLFPVTLGLLLALTLLPAVTGQPKSSPPKLAKPVGDGPWLRPADKTPAQPVWGHKDGLAIGLWPMSGPRGLLRIYAPYLGQKRPRMVNYISIEPVVQIRRGQSELEFGLASKERGLDFWTSDKRSNVTIPRDPTKPARGRIVQIDGKQALTFFLATEPFRNGARPILQVIFREDRPHEVGFRIHAPKNSARMTSCVLSATMGNYGRLRHLWLKGEVVDSRKLWPDFEPDRLGFAPWRAWDRTRMFQPNGQLIVAATSNEANPSQANYDRKIPPHWRYQGKPATHYWRAPDARGAEVRVNGRKTYWGESGPIPGGVSFENFELEIPFRDGQEFWFGVTPESPRALGFDPDWLKNLTAGQ